MQVNYENNKLTLPKEKINARGKKFKLRKIDVRKISYSWNKALSEKEIHFKDEISETAYDVNQILEERNIDNIYKTTIIDNEVPVIADVVIEPSNEEKHIPAETEKLNFVDSLKLDVKPEPVDSDSILSNEYQVDYTKGNKSNDSVVKMTKDDYIKVAYTMLDKLKGTPITKSSAGLGVFEIPSGLTKNIANNSKKQNQVKMTKGNFENKNEVFEENFAQQDNGKDELAAKVFEIFSKKNENGLKEDINELEQILSSEEKMSKYIEDFKYHMSVLDDFIENGYQIEEKGHTR